MEGVKELVSASFELINLPYTLLFLAAVVYWITVIIGVLDIDILNFDVDADADVHVEAGGDAHAEGGGFFWAVLGFFGFGEIPVTIILSFLFLCMWVGSLLANYYLQNDSGLIALALFMPNLLAGLIVTKILSAPYLKLFRSMGGISDKDRLKIIGNTCVVVSGEVTKEVGQAEIQSKGAPVRLNVRAASGTSLGKGEEAVVTEYDKDKKVYVIRSLKSEG